MTRTAIVFPREGRSYSPCATHAREDRPARRTLPFFSIRRTDPPQTDMTWSFSSIFRKLAKWRARPLRFLERVVVTPRARHTPEKTDQRVELCRFSRFAELIPRRRIGLSRFSRFVSKSWQNDAPGRSFVYMHKWSLPSSSPSFPSLSLRRPGPGRAGPRRAVNGARPGFGTRPAARLRRTRAGRASAGDRRPGFGTRPGFGAHDRARFRHAACSTDPP